MMFGQRLSWPRRLYVGFTDGGQCFENQISQLCEKDAHSWRRRRSCFEIFDQSRGARPAGQGQDARDHRQRTTPGRQFYREGSHAHERNAPARGTGRGVFGAEEGIIIQLEELGPVVFSEQKKVEN